MTNPRIILTGAAALLALAACQQEPEHVERFDPQADALANAAPVELPPAIQNSRTYRCRDNRLIYVEFLTNDTARLRLEQGGDPIRLVAEDGTPPYVADGYSISANAEQVSATIPGRGTQTCRA